MQTRNQGRWIITIVVCLVAVGVLLTAYFTRDLWAAPSTANTDDATGNGQSYGAYNGQFPAADTSTGSGSSHPSAASSNIVSPTMTAAPAISDTAKVTDTAPLARVANVPTAKSNVVTSDSAMNNAVTSDTVATGTLEIPATVIKTQPAVVGADGAQLLDAPHGKVVASLMTGTLLQALAGSSDQSWIQVQAEDASRQNGWIAAPQLLLADPTTLPVVGEQTSNPLTGTVPSGTVATGALLQEAQAGANTAAPSSQPQAATTLQATIASGVNRLNIRSGPSTDAAIMASATNGAQYTVVARNSDSTWLEINTTTGSVASNGIATGWVSATYVTVAGDVNTLPIAGQ